MHEECHQPAEDPRAHGGNREIAGQTPPPQEQHRHHQEADGPQCRQLVEDEEERAGAVGDRVEEPDDRFLGGRRVVRVYDERDQQEHREGSPGRVAGPPTGGALGPFARGDVAEVGQQRPDGAHHPPCLARRPPGFVSRRWWRGATVWPNFTPNG